MGYGDTLYKFSFESAKNSNGSSGMKYHVIAYSMDDMYTFLRQHKFDIEMAMHAITIHDKYEIHEYESNYLKPYQFKSNVRKGVFTVMTTEYIIDLMLENVTADLTHSLLLGEAIFRRDVEVFRMIADIITKLPHVHIIDFTRVDVESATLPEDKYVYDMIKLQQQYAKHIGAPTEDADYVGILDNLEHYQLNEPVSPITIEGYVSQFTEMMMDTYSY